MAYITTKMQTAAGGLAHDRAALSAPRLMHTKGNLKTHTRARLKKVNAVC